MGSKADQDPAEGSTDNVRSGGAVAQLVERIHGMDEVAGSNPVSSTLRGHMTTEGQSGSAAGTLAAACPSAVGARAELEIASALARAGWEVYLPFFAPHSRVDLVIDHGEGLKRVQCKKARLNQNEHVVSFATCSNTPPVRKDYREDVDLFGVYCLELDEVYVVPVEDTATRICHLRLAPARNGQRRGIRFAADYLVRRADPGSRPERPA